MFMQSKEPEKKGSEKKRRFARFVFERCSFRFCDYTMNERVESSSTSNILSFLIAFKIDYKLCALTGFTFHINTPAH